MTEPKQSFTEELQKQALKHGADFDHGDKADIAAQSFYAGAQSALSILSSKSEGREFWIDEVNRNDVYEPKPDHWDQCTHVIEHSALVAERARNAALESELKIKRLQMEKMIAAEANNPPMTKGLYARIAELEAENAALNQKLETFEYSGESKSMEIRQLRAQLELCKEQRNQELSSYRYVKGFTPADVREMIAAKDLELQKKGQGDE